MHWVYNSELNFVEVGEMSSIILEKKKIFFISY